MLYFQTVVFCHCSLKKTKTAVNNRTEKPHVNIFLDNFVISLDILAVKNLKKAKCTLFLRSFRLFPGLLRLLKREHPDFSQ